MTITCNAEISELITKAKENVHKNRMKEVDDGSTHMCASPPAGRRAPWQRGRAPQTAGVTTGGEEPRARKGVCLDQSVFVHVYQPCRVCMTPYCVCASVCLSVRLCVCVSVSVRARAPVFMG